MPRKRVDLSLPYLGVQHGDDRGAGGLPYRRRRRRRGGDFRGPEPLTTARDRARRVEIAAATTVVFVVDDASCERGMRRALDG